MKEPLVSVKMITYNHAPYIAQAIEGVLHQKTNFPFELVIGEDCSTDGTREIVLEYQKKYPDIIRVITSEQNVGARMNGYRTEKACRGKYVTYCEGDDYWHNPYKLQKQVNYLENHAECGLVFSDYDVYVVATGERIQCFNIYRKKSFPSNPSICDIVEARCPIVTCTVVVRRNLLERVVDSDPILYQSGRFLMGDTPRWAEISCLAKVAYINESLATHNVLLESAAHSSDVTKVLRFGKSGGELLLYLCDKFNLPPTTRSKCQEYWCTCALWLAFYEKNVQLGKEVKRVKGRFTVKERLQFWGSQSTFWNFALRPVICLNKHIKKCFCDEDNY